MVIGYYGDWLQEEVAQHLPGVTNAHLFHDDEIGDVLMSLSALSSSMSIRDHMISNRLPQSVKVPVVPQRHQFVDYDVFYGILLSPDVINTTSLDVVALKVTMATTIPPIFMSSIIRNVSVM